MRKTKSNNDWIPTPISSAGQPWFILGEANNSEGHQDLPGWIFFSSKKIISSQRSIANLKCCLAQLTFSLRKNAVSTWYSYAVFHCWNGWIFKAIFTIYSDATIWNLFCSFEAVELPFLASKKEQTFGRWGQFKLSATLVVLTVVVWMLEKVG